jgi:uncharacterized protein YbjQ (UPF0145 family)
MSIDNCIECNKTLPTSSLVKGICLGCRLLIESKSSQSSKINNETDAQNIIEIAKRIKLTTSFSFTNFDIEDEVGIVTSECVFGMNVFRDFFAGVSDFFGGRSNASQKVLRDARNTCLAELKKEAYEIGADGVMGIDLDYSEISGKGKGMLFLVASGTAVKLKPKSDL